MLHYSPTSTLRSQSLECHFIMRGPDDSPYAGGEYHGVLVFTSQYPFAPPGIKMFTPSGRFQVSMRAVTVHLHVHSYRCTYMTPELTVARQFI